MLIFKLALAALCILLTLAGVALAMGVAGQAAVSAYYYGDGYLACLQFLTFAVSCLWALICLVEWMAGQ